jgi:hypothetical protein
MTNELEEIKTSERNTESDTKERNNRVGFRCFMCTSQARVYKELRLGKGLGRDFGWRVDALRRANACCLLPSAYCPQLFAGRECFAD